MGFTENIERNKFAVEALVLLIFPCNKNRYRMTTFIDNLPKVAYLEGRVEAVPSIQLTIHFDGPAPLYLYLYLLSYIYVTTTTTVICVIYTPDKL